MVRLQSVMTCFLTGLLLFMCSCFSDDDATSHVVATGSKPLAQPGQQKMHRKARKDFDTEKFLRLADSLVSSIANERIDIQYRTDTVSHVWFAHLKQADLVLHHSFYTGKKRSLLRFGIYESMYSNKDSLNSDFTILYNDAMDIRDSTAMFSPGLTYSNDYVIKTDTSIFWLNLPCPYSQKNVKRVKQIFMQSLAVKEIKDSINCGCGASVCE